MIEIIMDEKTWCENVLGSFSMGAAPAATLSRLAKYYFHLGYKKPSIARLLEEFILRCNPSANIMRWQEIVDSCVSHADRRPLISIGSIDVTSEELSKIGALSGAMAQRLMFTLLCLAKYRNAVSPKNDSWVGYELRDIFKMANIQTTKSRQYSMLNDLLVSGYVQMSKIVDNVSVRVAIDNPAGNTELSITDFRNLGNQYSNYLGGGFIECEHCGLVIKRCGRNHKYCKACADAVKSHSSAISLGVA